MIEMPVRWPNFLTGDELLALGDIGPADLIAGRIVRRGFKTVQNATCAGNFAEALSRHARRINAGRVLIGGIGIYTHRNPDTIRAAGVRLVWVADPDEQTVYAYRSPIAVREFKSGDSLTADDILNGFVVLVAYLFEQ